MEQLVSAKYLKAIFKYFFFELLSEIDAPTYGLCCVWVVFKFLSLSATGIVYVYDQLTEDN